LPTCRAAAQFADISTLTEPQKPTRKIAAVKSVKKSSPRQTRAVFVAEVKAIAARVDAGKERMYSGKEVERELGL
jgi:hypothetical protein